jgi:hypothetical protein
MNAGIITGIEKGLPSGWMPLPTPDEVQDENFQVAMAGSVGQERLAIVYVSHLGTTARPYFDANAQLLDAGFRTVWLFNERGIPSTSHMPCATVTQSGSRFITSIQNVQDRTTKSQPQHYELAELVRAATESRLKKVTVGPDAPISVRFTVRDCRCPHCDSTTVAVAECSLKLASSSHIPALHLKGHEIGWSLGRELLAIVRNDHSLHEKKHRTTARRCLYCPGDLNAESRARMLTIVTQGEVSLSKVAALELLRHLKTSWYIE